MPFVTPEQAKKMRCCKPEFVNCKADECMGWRWKPKETRVIREDKPVPEGWVETHDDWHNAFNDEDDGKPKYVEYEKVEAEKTGYCGIAGHVPMND